MNRMILLAPLGSFLLASSATLAQSPFDGTWKIDMNKVTLPQKPDVYLLENGMYSCKSCTPPYTVKADGTDQPVSGQPYFDTVAVKVVNDHEIQETDKKAGKTVAEPVTAAIIEDHQNKTLVDVTVANGTFVAQPGTITATDYHPFWDSDHHKWTQAKDLNPGSHLLTLGGRTAFVTTIHTHQEHDISLRNLTIYQLHTYYVVAGSTSVLVHNCPSEGTEGGSVPESNRQIHEQVRSGERGISPTEVMVNAERILYDDNGNQIYIWSQNDGTNQVTIRDPGNSNIVTNQWSTDEWIERQIEKGRWFELN